MVSIKIKPKFKLLSIMLLALVFSSISFAQNQTFTSTELAKYNGKNGAKAYVAINGKVYDVTKFPQWAQGKHFCPGSFAGKDITDLWKRSPHFSKANYLSRIPVVGTLVSEQAKSLVRPSPGISPSPGQQEKPETTPKPERSSPNRSLLSNPILLTLALILGFTIIWLILRPRRK